MKDFKKLNHHQDSKSQLEENSKMHQLSDQSMENVEEHTGASTEPMGSGLGGGEKDSSDNLTTQVKLQEEHSKSFSQFYNRAPAPGGSHSSSQDKSFGDHSLRKCLSLKIQGKSKKIIKEKKVAGKPATNNVGKKSGSRSGPRSRSRSISSTDPLREISGRENHRKYTLKKVSNFLRKELKRLGCNFSLLEAKNNNKRGSRIYINVALLELKYLLKNRFPEFILSYIRDCDRQIAEYASQQEQFGWTERNEKYIEDFNKAKDSAIKFLQYDYIQSIKLFFGTGKEERYLNKSISYFIHCEKILDEKHLFDVLTL